ncbi:MAG: winged helix-turn-helix transcriptional regulator [Candidatus Omnitrophota bacterium]|jgi:predicted ArsR family transcriptional regulator|nr:MAG: winged helix-turn-helix transcriptional regulator [Candidatus Omnitrophota bacterium]
MKEKAMKRERPARMEIMGLLKKNGRMTARQIGEALGITPMGARQHLIAMEKDNLILSEFVRQKAGRPTLYYTLSQDSQDYFPQNYVALVLNLLKGLEELDGREKINEVLQLRREKLMKAYLPQMKGLSNEEKVRLLAELRERDGYMAEFELKDGLLILKEHNCPIFSVAKEYPEVCRLELELFRELLDCPIERAEHLINDQHACVYKILNKK